VTERCLRDALAAVDPAAPRLQRAWPRLISAWRDLGDERADALAGRGPLDRVLNGPVPVDFDVVEARRELAELVEAEGPRLQELAASLLARFAPYASRWVEGPVDVHVRGWPLGLGLSNPRRIVADLVGERWMAVVDRPTAIPPVDAAVLVRNLDGVMLAGAQLVVDVALPQGFSLPSVSRDRRAVAGPRGGGGSWLPHVDQEGRWSLSPRWMAEAQARRLGARRVIDPYCGLGGNSIAFALGGAQVLAVEADPARYDLCRRNLRALGVADRVDLWRGDGLWLLPELRRRWPDAAVFLDPPWGAGGIAPTAGEAWSTWERLVPGNAACMDSLAAAPALLLKAPRAFDPASLPGSDWQLQFEIDASAQALARVKALSLLRR
jgi:RNA cap guanine-N2 methyltransferase